MLQLAINTSLEPYFISILNDEKLLNEFSWSFTDTGRNDHISGLDFLLKNLNLSLKDIDFITILEGPGSFTGLRIGFTFVKTINFVFKTPVVMVNSFEAIEDSIKLKDFFVVINAGLKEVFVYENKKIQIKKFDEIKKSNSKNIFVFPEFYLFKEFEKGIYVKINSINLGRVGYKKFIDGKIASLNELKPLYLREAETIFKKFK
ncbi:MAG: tRNA (adenosine(37)-N6)-threonylcarbamoyltransferase complex dimerization subunit type 1 TsaB [Caldisericia bacterium]|nr:tRNA (adenosine(37)-N6)-threonylcarbamoyltransferase complex dimerization subunit type 1 TsaB [Caldisericia bacterium]